MNAHTIFLEQPSSGTRKIERLENQITFLGAIKPKALNRVDKLNKLRFEALQKPKVTIDNGQSSDTGNLGYMTQNNDRQIKRNKKRTKHMSNPTRQENKQKVLMKGETFLFLIRHHSVIHPVKVLSMIEERTNLRKSEEINCH